jgi:hypothetical protein
MLGFALASRTESVFLAALSFSHFSIAWTGVIDFIAIAFVVILRLCHSWILEFLLAVINLKPSNLERVVVRLADRVSNQFALLARHC